MLLRGSSPKRLDFVWEPFEFMSTFLPKLAVQWNIQFPNICCLKRCNLKFTTWSVVCFCFFALPRDQLCVLQLTMKDTNLVFVVWLFVCLFRWATTLVSPMIFPDQYVESIFEGRILGVTWPGDQIFWGSLVWGKEWYVKVLVTYHDWSVRSFWAKAGPP